MPMPMVRWDNFNSLLIGLKIVTITFENYLPLSSKIEDRSGNFFHRFMPSGNAYTCAPIDL